VRVKFKDRRQFESCWLKDISAGGIFLRTQTPAALFGKLAVVLELPNGDSVELTGEVVRVVAPQQAGPGVAAGMGVQFVDLDAEKRSQLEAYLGFTQPVALPHGLIDLSAPRVAPEDMDTMPPAPPVQARPLPGMPPAAPAPQPQPLSLPVSGPAGPPAPQKRTTTPAGGVRTTPASGTQRTLTPPVGTPRVLPSDAAGGPPPPSPPVLGIEDMVQGLRRMLWLCADSAALADADYYEILGISPTASGTQIADACAVLRTLIDPTNEPPGVRHATSARFRDLCRLLDEIEATLVDTGRRARYDGSRRRR
jgi:uncharacterized protein (TIGR02266 family)